MGVEESERDVEWEEEGRYTREMREKNAWNSKGGEKDVLFFNLELSAAPLLYFMWSS
jgi:hypothetical protein